MVTKGRVAEHDAWVPQSDADREAIRRELDFIRNSPLFAGSKRYPAFLEYVVDETLAGRADQLKERNVGIAVFGRSPSYDTNQDNVVRAAAGEIRRRLLKHYTRTNQDKEISIDLPTGSYVPTFHKRVIGSKVAASESGTQRFLTIRRRTWAILATTAAATGLIALLVWNAAAPASTPLDLFWQPLLDSNGRVLLCMGTSATTRRVFSQPSASTNGQVSFLRAVSLANLVAFLRSKNKTYAIQDDAASNLADLRSGPAVVIGALNNEWAIRLTEPLRYSLKSDPKSGIGWIADRQQPDKVRWTRNFSEPPGAVGEDYALIARFADASIGRMVLVVAGLHASGTAAATEFLTDPDQMRSLEYGAPRDWARQNLEVILATKVVDGSAGRPRVIESYYWRP